MLFDNFIVLFLKFIFDNRLFNREYKKYKMFCFGNDIFYGIKIYYVNYGIVLFVICYEFICYRYLLNFLFKM